MKQLPLFRMVLYAAVAAMGIVMAGTGNPVMGSIQTVMGIIGMMIAAFQVLRDQ